VSETVRVTIALIAAFAGGEAAGIAIMLRCPPAPLRRAAARAGWTYRAHAVTATAPTRTAVAAPGRPALEKRRQP
jgi:hypothetical protein